VWKDAFGKRPNTVLIQLSHWDTQECVDAVLTACQGVLPDVIVCPNDNCALALNDSLPSELRQQHPLRIVGYDGLDRMTAAIAEPEVSLGLTLRIPPDLFGRVAASVVREELRLFSPHRDRGRCERKVPTDLDGGYVMTTSRAFRRLYDGR
jgi:DNA-binding LacI/PurR family transcriptional regulator